MSSLIVLEHRVNDFEAWKQAFDHDPIGRARGGVTRHTICRPADDPDRVVVSLAFGSREQAEAFLPGLRELWQRVGDEIGFDGPDAVQVRVVDELESVDY